MTANSSRRAPMLSLQELYRIYTTIADKPVPLDAFRLSVEETEKLFSSFDEDYHISRFFHFSDSGGDKHLINGETATHVLIDPEISTIL